MSGYLYRTPTNDRAGSQYNVLGHLMPACVFVLVDKPGKDGCRAQQLRNNLSRRNPKFI